MASAFLLAAVVGSGIAGVEFSAGNVALALLANSLATGAMLAVLILVFGPVSGAHMNPAVSLVLALAGELKWQEVPAYVGAQIIGAGVGVIVAHLMFDLAPLQVSITSRSGPGEWLSEGVATFGLVLTIFGSARSPHSLPLSASISLPHIGSRLQHPSPILP
jgi:glycerol uptake facilitator-like aquaporin